MSGRPITEPEQDDGSHRMKIAERYKWNAKLRKLIKMLSICQIVYIVLRTIWQLIPVALGYYPIHPADLGIFLAGVLLYPLYQYAFGFGRSQYEKMWAIKLYAIFTVLLIGECFIRFWLYHVMFGPKSHDAEIAALYPRIPRSISNSLNIRDPTLSTLMFKGLDLFEKMLDVAGMGACTIGMFMLKEYISSQKEAMEETKSRSKQQ